MAIFHWFLFSSSGLAQESIATVGELGMDRLQLSSSCINIHSGALDASSSHHTDLNGYQDASRFSAMEEVRNSLSSAVASLFFLCSLVRGLLQLLLPLMQLLSVGLLSHHSALPRDWNMTST
ncbi:hypothetical protein E2C01_074288 [Portunus trituberculatus]|uniref:Uncharacterized protein n=1 Tax=Portunus trituberculatus TaxID=210409 RepID=A0A5B7IGP4_PORTR|nr:hypothetical protein [Portunus trituberculatus]